MCRFWLWILSALILAVRPAAAAGGGESRAVENAAGVIRAAKRTGNIVQAADGPALPGAGSFGTGNFQGAPAAWNTRRRMGDFAKYYEVDLNAPLPDIPQLEKEMRKASEVYNPRYIVSWDMGPVFDRLWSNVITTYGNSEKRLKRPDEDELVMLVGTLPREYYPYIGPYLHTLRGIPDKILMMPGIRETKNKFPERIAPQLAGIEDLEFLSPYLYILLMPEMWPDNHKAVEIPAVRPAKAPKIDYDPEFYSRVLDEVPGQGFGGALRSDKKPGKDDLRTLNIDKNSPLTAADIKAFLNTIDGVRQFGTLQNTLKIAEAGMVLDYWEHKNGTALPLNGLKDAVNPCQRLALKIKWAGMETEFEKAVAPEGFNLEEWAYTCDKTIKAYRIARVSAPKLAAMRIFKKGVYDAYINTLNPLWRDRQFAAMQSVMEMHKAPREDVLQALKNESFIKEKLTPLGGMLLTAPIAD